MDPGLLLICALTFIIHLIGTLAYSVRIAGTRTRQIALSLSLFNVLILISRTSNSFQAPLLAKRVEQNIAGGVNSGVGDFRWLLIFASAATLIGALLIPTFQRLLSRWVEFIGARRSPRALLQRAASLAFIAHVRDAATLPQWDNIAKLRSGRHIPWSVAALNTVPLAYLRHYMPGIYDQNSG